MSCCRPEPDDPVKALARNYSFGELFFKTFGRECRALKILVKAKLDLRRHIRNGETIPTLFTKTAKKYPHKTALIFVDTGKTWTFQQVNYLSNAVANYIIKQGFCKGDVIALYMENTPVFAIFWLGLAKVGVVASLINYNVVGKSLLHCIHLSGAKGIIYSAAFSQAMNDIKDELPEGLISYYYGKFMREEPDGIDINLDLKLSAKNTPDPPKGAGMHDTLFHIYTSGTTGLPKAAIITHTRFYWSCRVTGNFINITPYDIVYDVLPLYHSAGGILGLGMAYLFGTTVVIRKKFSASRFWTDCIQYKCTYIQYIGEMCRFLLAQPPKPTDTQHNVNSMYGNGFKPQIWKTFVKRFKIKNVREFYGATEGNCNIVNTTNRIGAVGFCTLLAKWAYPVFLIRVDNETGIPIRDSNGLCIRCKPGEPGQMVGKIIKSDPTRNFDGYVAIDARNDKCARDVLQKGDMAFLTGDIMVMDGLGYCYFRDRTGDTFRWRGENVSTQEVEAIISSVISLADSVVFGVEIPGTEGKAGMAAIVNDGNINLEKLYTELKKTLPPYALPVFIRLLKSGQAQMTSTFKLQKNAYRKEGYDPKQTKGDEVYYLNSSLGRYVLLDDEVFTAIQKQKLRL